MPKSIATNPYPNNSYKESKPSSEANPQDEKIQSFVKNYPIVRSPTSDKIRFKVTPNGKVKRGIYKIENKNKNLSYVGKAGRNFGSRLAKHTSDIHLQDRRASVLGKYKIYSDEPDLYEDLKSHPEDFAFSILREVEEDEDIDELEKEFIEICGSCEHGYNKNRGGGGGGAINHNEKTSFVPPVDPFSTPPKLYPMDHSGVELTPEGAEANHVVYLIIDRDTGKRYVGSTVQKLSKRLADHLSASHNPNSKAFNRALMKALRESDQQDRFEVGILYRGESLLDIRLAEAFYIDKENEKYELYNVNKGSQIPAKRLLF